MLIGHNGPLLRVLVTGSAYLRYGDWKLNFRRLLKKRESRWKKGRNRGENRGKRQSRPGWNQAEGWPMEICKSMVVSRRFSGKKGPFSFFDRLGPNLSANESILLLGHRPSAGYRGCGRS